MNTILNDNVLEVIIKIIYRDTYPIKSRQQRFDLCMVTKQFFSVTERVFPKDIITDKIIIRSFDLFYHVGNKNFYPGGLYITSFVDDNRIYQCIEQNKDKYKYLKKLSVNKGIDSATLITLLGKLPSITNVHIETRDLIDPEYLKIIADKCSVRISISNEMFIDHYSSLQFISEINCDIDCANINVIINILKMNKYKGKLTVEFFKKVEDRSYYDGPYFVEIKNNVATIVYR